MSNKKHSRHVPTWALIVASLLFMGLSTYLLRQNNLKMVELREAVVQADRNGEGVADALLLLNQHVFTHMNTTTVKPVELVASYNREVKRAIEARSKTDKDVYQEATKACEKQGLPLTSVAQCAAEYATKNGSAKKPTESQLPQKSLFVYSFASPRWTPDLAGIAVAISLFLLIWLLLRLLIFTGVKVWHRRHIKKHY